jgi:hypothetical protein
MATLSAFATIVFKQPSGGGTTPMELFLAGLTDWDSEIRQRLTTLSLL